MKTFNATEKLKIKGRGVVYVGPSPFEFARDSTMDAFAGKWAINLTEAHGKVFRVVGVESHCVPTIHEGAPIGLMVEEVLPEQ